MTLPPLILVCDHRGEGLAETLAPLAGIGFRTETTSSLRQSRERIEELRPEIILIDPLSLGGVVELEQIDQLRKPGSIPVLVVAEAENPLPALFASRSLEGGPWDLVYRGAPTEEFLMRIERLRSSVKGIAELDEMRYQAAHDDRTELLRPRPFDQRLREHFSAAQRHRFDLALLLVDLDRFGRVNKEFDHTIGDTVITRVGAVIRNSLRAEDIGGRLGGDEFAVVLPYTRRVDAARVVARIREQVLALTGPIDHSGREVQVSASLGFETFDGGDLETVETLRRHAEVALRHAKERGGNCGLYFRSLTLDGEDSGLPYQDRA